MEWPGALFQPLPLGSTEKGFIFSSTMEALAFTVRQMDPTMWTDYVAAVGVAAFTAFVLFCMAMVIFMAKVQYRTDIMLKGSLWICLWLAGGLLIVWSELVSNKFLDSLDPIRNFHCPLWDFWGLVMGVALYYSFQGYIMLESAIRSIARIEGMPQTYHCVEKPDHEAGDDDERGEWECTPEYIEVVIEEEEEDGMTEEDVDPTVERRVTAQLDRAAMKRVGLRASVADLFLRGWGNIAEARRYSLLKAAYMAYVFATAILVCVLAEIPGVTWYHKHAQACLTVWYFKTFVIVDMLTFLVLLWLLYRRLRSTKNLPTLSAATFRHLLTATTAILGLMVIINLTGVLTYYWGRFAYIFAIMLLITYSILQIIGKSMLETVLGRHSLDEAIEYHLSCRTLPTTFGQVMRDPDHIANIMPEFLGRVNKDRRVFLIENRHKLGGERPFFNAEDEIIEYEPGVGVDLDTHSIIFPRRLTNTLAMIRQRKRELADLIAAENAVGIDPYNRSIIDCHIVGRPVSYIRKQLESPNANIDFLERDVPAVPHTENWMMRMGDHLRNPQISTGPNLMDDVEFFIQTFLDLVYWGEFFNEPGTMRELRSAINMRTQLERNAARRVKKTGRGEAISERKSAPIMYQTDADSRTEGIVVMRDDDQVFTIEDDDDEAV